MSTNTRQFEEILKGQEQKSDELREKIQAKERESKEKPDRK